MNVVAFPKPPQSPAASRRQSNETNVGRDRSKKSKGKKSKTQQSPQIPRKLLQRGRSSSRESLHSLEDSEILVRHYSTEDLSVRHLVVT